MFANTSKLLVPLATLVVAGAVTVGSGASWTASKTTTTTVTGGVLSMSNNAATLNISAMKPGDSLTGTITIANTGTIPADLTLSESSPANAFVVAAGVSDLQLTVTQSGATPTVLFNGNFGDWNASSVNLGTLAPATTANTTDETTLTFVAKLGTNASDADQGQTANASYAFTTTQTANGSGLPWS